MLFASFRSELDTAPIAEWVLRAGKTLCLPRILGPRRMAAFRVTDPGADLAPGTWGIPEPREGLPEVPPETIDLVFVPGSAFDEEGGRCGYGGGFYDTYLPLTRPGTPRVALAFEAQLVPKIAGEAHDLSGDGHRHRAAGDQARLRPSAAASSAPRRRASPSSASSAAAAPASSAYPPQVNIGTSRSVERAT